MKISLGESRVLEDRYFGFNTPIMWDMPFEDPKAWPLFEGLRAGLMRFPGGMIANHWDWQAGRVTIPEAFPGSFRAGAEDAVRYHPQGSSYEDFCEVIGKWGVEANLVLNVETATVEDQVEWVEHLVKCGLRPTRIELGNELYFGKLFSEDTKFPDYETAAAHCKEYIDAIRPLVPEARFALLSSGSRFEGATEETGNPFHDHLVRWDDAIVDEDWFDALVIHLYPEIGGSMSEIPLFSLMGPTRQPIGDFVPGVAHLRSEGEAQFALACVLARAESGTRSQVDFVSSKAPRKEQWATEWGTGENAAFYRGENPIITGFWVHGIARQMMTFLSMPHVTQALNHSLYFDGRIWSAMRRVDGPEFYRAHGCYDVFRWFGEALDVAAGDITVHGATVDGAESVDAPGPHDEQYTDVMASVIDASSGKRTAIVHNAADRTIDLDVAELAGTAPASAEVIHTPALREEFSFSTPVIQRLAPGATHQLAPNSLARFVWDS